MARLSKLTIALVALIVFGFATQTVSAATLVVGASNDISRYPFGKDPGAASSAFPDFAAGGTYQQVYSSKAFPGPITIAQIAFASASQVTSGPGTAHYNVSISFSTTNKGPNGLSTDLASNRGADLAQVFTGPITATLNAADQFDLVIDVTPFAYDPANGNLLVEITVNTPAEFTGNPLYFRAGFSADSSRAANPSGIDGGAFTDGFGLETRFLTVAPTASEASISGRVTDSTGAAIPGVTLRVTGETSTSTITDGDGKYRIENIAAGTFYTVTPQLPNFHFVPAERSFSVVGNDIDVTFSGVADTTPTSNPIDSNEYFVRQQYLDFLDREPDQDGLQFWTNRLNECGFNAACLRKARIDISAGFFKSVEFQSTGSYVYRLYNVSLGRSDTYEEFVADRHQVIGGQTLDEDTLAYTAEFVTRPEFVERYAAYITADSFVDKVIDTTRETTGADVSRERATLIDLYNNSSRSTKTGRALVVEKVANNPAVAAAVINQAFVHMEYFGYLRREIDIGGYLFWLHNLIVRDPGNFRGMVCSFITSDEYQRRFGTVLTHSNAECGD